MEQPNDSGTGADLAKIQEMTGIMEGSEEKSEDTPVEKTPETKPEEKAEPKPDEGKEKAEAKREVKGEEKLAPKADTPDKNESRPLRAVFSQIKDLRSDLNKLVEAMKTTPSEKKEVTQVLDDAVKDIAERRNLDAEGLAEILAEAEKRTMKKLEDQGLLKKDLAPELQEKLKLLDSIEAKQKEEAIALKDKEEWLAFVPDLQKQYPNATPALLADAQKLMDELAHSKDFHDKELDYVLYKNRSKFDTILKVAKGSKAGESVSKDMAADDVDDDIEIDMDPENMTPEKMARFQKRQLNRKNGNDATLVG